MSERVLRLGALLAACMSAAACGTIAPPAPENADSYANFLVSRVADLRDDNEAASARYYLALARTPGDPVLLQGALASALATGDAERAREVARLAATHDADVAQAYLVRAVEALSAGRYRQARDQLARVRGTAADELTERILLAWARTGEGRVDEVSAESGRLDSSRPYAGLFAYQRALALDVAGRNDEARAAYAQADLTGFYMPPAAERRADLLMRMGQREAALTLLRARDNAILGQAAARIERGEAVARAPLTPARGAAISLFGLASLFMQESDPNAALSALTLSTMLDPDLDASRVAFAEAQIDMRRGPQARTALARVPETSPYSETARIMEAWILVQEERGDDAIVLARQLVESGGSPRAQRALADMYRSLNRFGEAEPIYSNLIEAQPNADWRLYFSRGVARERLGNWSEAEADLRQALALSPEQPEVLNYLGYTWVERGENIDEAMTLIQRAVEIRPLSGAIIDSLGWAYYRQGDYEQALEYLERAVELEPADTVLNDHLGDAYWRVGRRIEARFQWRRALGLDPMEESRVAIEEKLERGLPPAPRTRSATR